MDKQIKCFVEHGPSVSTNMANPENDQPSSTEPNRAQLNSTKLNQAQPSSTEFNRVQQECQQKIMYSVTIIAPAWRNLGPCAHPRQGKSRSLRTASCFSGSRSRVRRWRWRRLGASKRSSWIWERSLCGRPQEQARPCSRHPSRYSFLTVALAVRCCSLVSRLSGLPLVDRYRWRCFFAMRLLRTLT